MKKKLISALILGVLFSVTGSVQTFALPVSGEQNLQMDSTVDYSNAKESIQKKADVLVSNSKPYYNAASVEYAVSEGDNIIISGNSGVYSKTENRILMNDNMYGIGSQSKMFTTAAVMKLQDEGKINIDMPVTDYIPEFKMADERYRQITPRMLLSHMSGLMGTTYRNLILLDDNDTFAHDNFLKELEGQRLMANPGELSSYCNDGFTLAQILVEKVAGVNFSDYIKENFTEPLGLKNTKTPLDDFDRSKLVKTYTLSDYNADPVENVMSIGAGGIYSTSGDVCRFVNALTTRDGKGLLSNNAIDAMAQEECLKGVWPTGENDNSQAYGLGWDSVNLFPFNRYGIKALCKDGGTKAFHSSVINLPDYNITISVNSSGGSTGTDETFAAHALLDVLKDKGIINEFLPDVEMDKGKAEVMPPYLMGYSGEYSIKNQLIDIKIDVDGKLTYTNLLNKDENTNKEYYYYTYPGYFVSADKNEGVKFTNEKNGATYLEKKSYDYYEGLGQKASCLYIGQKVDKNELTDSEKEKWSERNSKRYLLVNEKYSSSCYAGGFWNRINQNEDGYAAGAKILNGNECLAVSKIPGMDGKEVVDFDFYNKDGIEYVKYGSLIGMCMDNCTMFNEDVKDVTIGEDGYTKWFKIPEEMAGKVLTAASSDKSAFVVYDAAGKCINDSYVSKNNTVTLEKDNLIAFAGNSGEKFDIEIK